jgi:hypothetical protein
MKFRAGAMPALAVALTGEWPYCDEMSTERYKILV